MAIINNISFIVISELFILIALKMLEEKMQKLDLLSKKKPKFLALFFNKKA